MTTLASSPPTNQPTFLAQQELEHGKHRYITFEYTAKFRGASSEPEIKLYRGEYVGRNSAISIDPGYHKLQNAQVSEDNGKMWEGTGYPNDTFKPENMGKITTYSPSEGT